MSTASQSVTAAPVSPSAQPRAALDTLGCRLNHADTELIRRKLVQAGYRIVPWGEPAEVMVLNSCTVTANADATTRQALRGARRAQPGAQLAVVGCHAQVHAGALAKSGLADLIVGNGDKLAVVEHLHPGAVRDAAAAPVVVRAPMKREAFAFDFDPDSLVSEDSTTRAHMKIQEGCDFGCSFCIIPRARGGSRPRALDNLLIEAAALVERGVQEIVVTGVNVGTYAFRPDAAGTGDETRTLVDAVDGLDRIVGLARIRIGSLEATTIDEGLFERMAAPDHKLVPFLHMPLQSGSDAVLKAMRRRYNAAEYEAFAMRALERVPDLCLGADVMAGFPGEGDDQFIETFDLLDRVPMAYFHIFPYSERPGTVAVKLPDSVPPSLRHRRVATLRALSETKRLAFHQRFVGRRMDVLFEKPRRADLAEGYTANFIRVKVPAADAAALRNRLLPVRLVEAGSSVVAGELVEPVVTG